MSTKYRYVKNVFTTDCNSVILLTRDICVLAEYSCSIEFSEWPIWIFLNNLSPETSLMLPIIRFHCFEKRNKFDFCHYIQLGYLLIDNPTTTGTYLKHNHLPLVTRTQIGVITRKSAANDIKLLPEWHQRAVLWKKISFENILKIKHGKKSLKHVFTQQRDTKKIWN